MRRVGSARRGSGGGTASAVSSPSMPDSEVDLAANSSICGPRCRGSTCQRMQLRDDIDVHEVPRMQNTSGNHSFTYDVLDFKQRRAPCAVNRARFLRWLAFC